MADSPYVSADLYQADNNVSTSVGGVTINTGDLRRSFALGDRISDLVVNRDSLFRVLSKLRKVSTNDPIFKVMQERSMVHKRYGIAVGHRAWSGSGSAPVTGYATTGSITGLGAETAGSYIALQMGCDYKSAGNIQNVFGQSTNAISVGDSGTAPIFFLKNQVVKINTKSANAGYTCDDYFLLKILDVQTSGNYAYIGGEVVRPLKTSTNYYLCSFSATSTPITTTYTRGVGTFASSTLVPQEHIRSYVVGSAFLEGSGYPDTFKDTPLSTTYSQTQIWKTACFWTGTAEATELKVYQNEKARIWADKLTQHAWDIADAIYWSTLRTDTDGARHTQGIVDWILSNANVFSFSTSTTKDDILDQMSILTDPRYNNMSQMIFLMPTYWYNYMHKLGGFALTNLKMAAGGFAATYPALAGFDFAGSKSLVGSELSTFATQYGTMNVMRDIHLDGSPIKMLGVNLSKIAYRPLVGNGKNRDTKILLGVQSEETTGIDATVDLIRTEAGVEITCGEAHAVWL